MKPEEIFRSPKTAQIVVIVTLISLVGLCIWVYLENSGNATPTSNMFDTVKLSWTPVSSLPEDLAYAEKLRQWVGINGGCPLPCFLGITPGKTTWEIVQMSLEPFTPQYNDDFVSLFDPAHNVHISTQFTLTPDSDDPAAKVERIEVDLRAENMGASSYYSQLFEPYLLASVLTQLGEPSQIWVQVGDLNNIDLSKLGGAYEYRLALSYDQLGLTITYRWIVDVSDKVWKLCPGKGVMISLYIATPEKSFPIDKIFYLVPPYYSLEQATDMDIVTFYETFKDADSQACLETPAKLWR